MLDVRFSSTVISLPGPDEQFTLLEMGTKFCNGSLDKVDASVPSSNINLKPRSAARVWLSAAGNISSTIVTSRDIAAAHRDRTQNLLTISEVCDDDSSLRLGI